MPAIKKEEELKQKSLKISVKEGSAASVVTALGHTYVIPFLLALKATTTQIGVISSLAGLISPIGQLLGSKFIEKESRKKVATYYVLLQALLWIPLAIIGMLFWKGVVGTPLIYTSIVIYTLISLVGGIAYSAWFSWMGDLVNDKERGRYFSRRNLIGGTVEILFAIVSILIIKYLEPRGAVIIGYTIFFLVASVARILCFYLLRRQFSPKIKIRKKSEFSLYAFVKRYDNFGKFAVYQFFFHVSLMIASPFFMVYMARELGFSPALYVGISLAGSVYYLLFLPLVGKFSDRYGNRRLLVIANLGFVLSPLSWLFLKNPIALMLIPQAISGLANAAMIIGLSNFTYDSVSPEKRALCISYTNILAGLGTFVGSLAGGFLIDNLQITFMNTFFFVFILAAVLRLVVALAFIPQIQEVKKVSRLNISLNVAHPWKSITSDIHWFKHFLKYH